MDSEIFEQLKLEPKNVMRDYEISLGLANIYSGETKDERIENENNLPIAATYYRRAAANLLLLGHFTDAKNLFQIASKVYRKLGMPYSVAIASLAYGGVTNRQDIPDAWLFQSNEHEFEERYVPQLAYIVLAQVSNSKLESSLYDRVLQIRRFLEPYRLQSVGILGMSVGSILDIADSIVPDLGTRQVDIFEAMTPFLSTYNSALNHSIQNRYVWRLLAFPFHPAEPDIYSVLTMANTALRFHKDISIMRYIKDSPISRHSKYLINSLMDGIIYGDDEHFHEKQISDM